MDSAVRVVVDEVKLRRAIRNAENLGEALEVRVSGIVGRANAISAGYRTPRWHDHETGEVKGNTRPEYGGDVRDGKKGPIGIVHPLNYAAMKDNHLHNTMLKAT